MEIKQYQAAVEAVLFASGEPIAASRLAEVLELDEETTVRLADDLMQEVNTRSGGLLIVRLGDQYQMCTKSSYADYIRKALDIRRNTPLSQAAMETLAIKYAPNDTAARREQAIQREWKPLCVLKMDIDCMTGKEAVELVAKKQKKEN